ncbi:Na+/H+ antiporter NhaA [Myxococcus llanfairpwllgwyngyllgogerychwyrndrobwllllantysiliogogogochensis]|uniref:Na(+)/H(+) antiporter NhaA n=1 Tax=Myxococcus llanfairpwllgwyngyllgogerychwyrndrobwllllantysiliogogogochensis TaxID=2590453 RepID=A0A540WQY7_9BACT|nr:Na+/H+ antiporter NhaA [Myxococcus llanfairpwllgwyngyllgogerychwyrndrobwllllantysiliogogogochensis]TQF11436.1 Na+/H+ antiporter NhaA [Myxococcus llanfairpwllgwyngyllgogerychwyrndrobwllllantysiliogogogochensis]
METPSTTPSPRTRAPAPVPALFRVAIAPLQAFFRLQASSGILLALCSVVAMVWANSPWASSYVGLFDARLELGVAGTHASFTFQQLINDGLMTLFFFLVGMEVKRELSAGELRTMSRAMLPLIAALGGMVVPAALYVAINAGTPAMAGWAIPMATDIAFAIGCLTLVKARVGHGLIVFLTALAIFDDIGGILVIALFYGTGLHVEWLLGAAAVVGVLMALNRFYVRNGIVWLLGGVALWYTMHHGGIHATLAGVVVGLCIPSRPTRPGRNVLEELSTYIRDCTQNAEDESMRSAQLLYIEDRLEELEPPLNRFEHLWHGWVAYGIVPLFALANSGISVAGMGWKDLLAPLPLGIIAGLFVGKQVGIFLFTLAAVKLRVSTLPGGAGLGQLHGVSVVAGIGFTVALFVAGLAFAGQPELLNEAKLGILVGSLLSAVVGYVLLRFVAKPVAQA